MRRITLSVISLSAAVCTLISVAPQASAAPADRAGTFQLQAQAEPRPTSRVTATASTLNADPGTVITVAGALEQQSGSDWLPIAGQTVVVGPAWDDVAGSDGQRVTVTTDDTGHFSTPYTMGATGGKIQVRYGFDQNGNDAGGPYLPTSTYTANVVVRKPINFPSFTVSYDQYAMVTINGSVSSGQYDVTVPALNVEYSHNGKTGWSVKKKLRSNPNSSYFTTKFEYNQSGYWRVRFTGTTRFMPAVSPVRKAWRWNTHFTGFKVSPKKVRFKQRVTVSGKLNRYYALGKKKGFAKQKVYIYFTCDSDKRTVWYSDSGWVRTNSKGLFKKRVRAYCTGKWMAFYYGGRDTFAAGSDYYRIKVTGTPKRLSTRSATEAPALPGGFVPQPSLLDLIGGSGRSAASIG